MTWTSNGGVTLLVPAGPSKDVTVQFSRANGTLPITRVVSFRVPASSTIRASSRVVSGAATVRFSGRLGTRGATIPDGGKIVELQARQGGRWSTVAPPRPPVLARGGPVPRHAGPLPGARLRIRREATFGYELGYSPPIAVTVR